MSTPHVRHAELLLDARNSTGECPVWHAAEQALYWVDIPQKTLHRYQVHSGSQQRWVAPEMLACMAPGSAPGQWIAGAESGLFALDTLATDSLGFAPIATVTHPMPGMRFNDGRCDRQGRFMAGTMLMDMAAARAVGSIYQLRGDGRLQAVLGGFVTPNGMAFSPDGRTMYLSDSHPTVRQVWAYDYDVAEGLPTRPRPFIAMDRFTGRPDGAAMDTDGGYWICGNDAGLVHRYTPQGRLDFSVALPVDKPAMCAFGGADLRTLFITTIRPAIGAQALAGGVFAIHLGDVQGLAEPLCRLH